MPEFSGVAALMVPELPATLHKFFSVERHSSVCPGIQVPVYVNISASFKTVLK